MSGSPFHASIHIGSDVIVTPKLARLVEAVLTNASSGARWMVGKKYWKAAQGAHVEESFCCHWLAVPCGIRRPGFILVELTLDVEEHLPLILCIRNDQRVVIHCRHVELHAIKLQHLRYGFARLLKFRVSMDQIYF